MGQDQRFKYTERYIVGWTDWRAAYGTPPPSRWRRCKATVKSYLAQDVMGRLIGAALIMTPVTVAAWLFWRWMGWL